MMDDALYKLSCVVRPLVPAPRSGDHGPVIVAQVYTFRREYQVSRAHRRGQRNAKCQLLSANRSPWISLTDRSFRSRIDHLYFTMSQLICDSTVEQSAPDRRPQPSQEVIDAICPLYPHAHGAVTLRLRRGRSVGPTAR